MDNRPFFIHQWWDNPIKIGKFPKKHRLTSGDFQIAICSSDIQGPGSQFVAEMLDFVWEYINEYLPWEEAPKLTGKSIDKFLGREKKNLMNESFRICQSGNTDAKIDEMLKEAGLDGNSWWRIEPKQEEKQRKQLIENLRLEFEAHNARSQQKPTISITLDKLKSKVKGHENVEGVHYLSGVVQPTSHKHKS
ncbi:MAG: hypothetical protein Q9223_001095 [Gallowayella weberi]